jgi:hypothetical protein
MSIIRRRRPEEVLDRTYLILVGIDALTCGFLLRVALFVATWRRG